MIRILFVLKVQLGYALIYTLYKLTLAQTLRPQISRATPNRHSSSSTSPLASQGGNAAALQHTTNISISCYTQ
jgi:hypothetical protein